jgi:Uma2 family endonuclease
MFTTAFVLTKAGTVEYSQTGIAKEGIRSRPKGEAMSTAEGARPVEQRFRMSALSWEGYLHLGQVLAGRHVRMAYDRGELEIMAVSLGHDGDKSLLARLVNLVTEEMAIDIRSGGSTTLNREDLERGLEGDECWWIEHEAQVRSLREIDLNRDPPPDLALEVEISRSLLNRIKIYAALRVPEVWRWDGQVLTVCLLDADGNYVISGTSRNFPFLPVAELGRFVHMLRTMSETSVIRAFREWVRQHADEWRAAGI